MKIKKLSRVIAAVVLSAALMMEPYTGITVVHAEGIQTMSRDNANEKDGQEKQASTADSEMENSDESMEKPGSTGAENDTAESNSPENAGTNESTEETGDEKDDAAAEDSETENGGEDGNDPDAGSDNEKPEDSESEGNGGTEDIPGGEADTNDVDDGVTEDGIEDENAGEEEQEGDLEEKISDEEAVLEEESKMKEDFRDMPGEYRLTSYQKELKLGLSSDLEQIKESDEGITYAAGRVFTFAQSQEEAELIAEAYRAEIEEFSMGVLTLELSADRTVREAVAAAASMDNSLPAVWPDYRRELYEEIFSESEDRFQADRAAELELSEEEYGIEEETDLLQAEGDISAREAYGQALSELTGFSDPYLDPASDRYQWFHTAIGAPYAWEAGYTGQSVTVGVIDTGVSPNPDLDDNLVGGYNFCDGTEDTADDYQHGTHVAGTIAALANGEQGVGVAPGAKIYNAKVFGDDASKSGYDSTIMKAILYLINEESNSTQRANSEAPRANIINMSLGGSGDTAGFQAVIDKAREKGVIVFAATGNDGASTMMYPASYEHVIAVAATDTNTERAYFSNYGYKTDLAAPGVNIWATNVDRDGTAIYSSQQGTSMACPVAAGTAAVILSGQADLPSLDGKSGAERVDALEAVMRGNTISAGAGMGDGITNLAQVFHLSTAVMKPGAPDIDISDNSDQKRQSVEVRITAQAGMRLCYTTNGRNPVYKNETAGAHTTLVEGNEISFTLDGSQAVNGTVKAFAISEDGVISPVKSKSYKLSPYVKTINVTGPARVERGRSIQLTATVSPGYAANKKVTWNLRDSSGELVDITKIKIDGKGKITVAAEADLGTYTVIAQAGDGGNAETRYEIQVIRKGTAVTSISFDSNMTKELWITKETPVPTMHLADFTTVREKDESGKELAYRGDKLGDRVIWTSSKPAIAEVDSRGIVTAKSAGTVTITARSNDNSNRKTNIRIKVKQGVTEITITTAKGKTDQELFTVAAGRSMTLKSSVSPLRPASKKVEWSISPVSADVTIHKTSGKISVKPGTESGIYTVTAKASDGKGAVAQQEVKVFGGAVGKISLDVSKTTLYTKKVDDTKTDSRIITATIIGADGRTDFDPNAYTITSSNESVVRVASVSGEKGKVQITITSAGKKYGKAKVTIASTDGSNKKAVCNVTVSGGIKSVEMQDVAGKKVSSLKLFRAVGSGAQETAVLKVVIKGSEGVNPASCDVVSSNPALVKVSLNKLTNEIMISASKKSTGRATVTLKATDGSGKKASCSVTVSNPVSRIHIAPKAGTTRYVVSGKSVQLTAVLETEYGKVSDRRVNWELSNKAAGMGITINSAGKITVPTGLEGRAEDFTVTATVRDGSGIKASYTICLRPPTTRFEIQSQMNEKYEVYKLYTIKFTSDCATPVSCTSSEPGIAAPSIVYTQYDPNTKTGGTGRITFMATGEGDVTFTISALDTSDKTHEVKCTFQKNERGSALAWRKG